MIGNLVDIGGCRGRAEPGDLYVAELSFI